LSFPPIQGVITATSSQAKEKLRFGVPGTLNTTENAYIPVVWVDYACVVEKLECMVRTAAAGASIILTFKKITKSTGVLGATVGTVTIAAAAFDASSLPEVSLTAAEGLVMEVTQVGSVNTEGSNLSGMATVRAA